MASLSDLRFRKAAVEARNVYDAMLPSSRHVGVHGAAVVGGLGAGMVTTNSPHRKAYIAAGGLAGGAGALYAARTALRTGSFWGHGESLAKSIFRF